MTFTHWYRDCEQKETQKDVKKLKNEARAKQVAYRLQSILLEDNPYKLLRQQAGLDRRNASKRSMATAPKVFKVQQEYDRKRKQRKRMLQKAQREQRQFHSKPVPNFSELHKRWESRNRRRQMKSQQKFTEPTTPRTLLNSIESRKRWETTMHGIKEQQSRELTLRPNLLSNALHSWRRPPFVPRILSSIVKTKPFHLASVKRGKKRKQFDVWNMREQQQRWQMKAVAWARRCQQEYWQARKLTNFKAKPNPWKRTKAKI